MTAAIVIKDVRKTFGPKVAVENLDLTIPSGSLVGLIGPNGAGKSTTIRMVMSILFPDRGELEVLGKKSAVESKDRIGYLPEERGIYRKMRVAAFLEYMARLKGVSGDGLTRRVRDWLGRVGLGDVTKKKCEELSKGMQQKVQVLAAIIHEPDLVILDEPFSGLDPVNSRLLRELIDEQHARGATVIFSTHQMTQAEALCDRIVMIHQGRKVLDNTLGEIRATHTPRAVCFEPAEGADPSVIGRLAGVESVSKLNQGFVARMAEGVEPWSMVPTIAASLRLERVEVQRPSLEDVFIDIVQGTNLSEAERDEFRAALHASAPKGDPA